MTTPHTHPADPYVYPGTRVLINRFGIRDPVELAQAADDISYATITRLLADPVPGEFDLAHLQRIHEAIWGEIYPWAGQIRTIGIAKDGVPFCPSRDIHTAAEKTFGRLADEGALRGLDVDPFVDRLTHYHGAVNYLHPFREGNGRTQRVFFSHLAEQAGYHIAWDRLDPVVNDYASYQQAALNQHQPMRHILTDLVEDRRPQANADPARQATRLHELAEGVRADAAAHQAVATHLRRLAAEGTGPHITELQQRRAHLDTQVRAIRELDDDALNRTQLTAEQATRLEHLAGPDPGRTRVLEEHRTLTGRWDSLHASSQALDDLAAERPADLARRQRTRAQAIDQRADALDPAAAPESETAAHRLRTARRSLHSTPEPEAATPSGDLAADTTPHQPGEPRPAMPSRQSLYAAAEPDTLTPATDEPLLPDPTADSSP